MVLEDQSLESEYPMASLRHIHQMMNERRMVQLVDGRIGKVVRVDTTFPGNTTTVSVWTGSSGEATGAPFSSSSPPSSSTSSPGLAKVALTDILDEATKSA